MISPEVILVIVTIFYIYFFSNINLPAKTQLVYNTLGQWVGPVNFVFLSHLHLWEINRSEEQTGLKAGHELTKWQGRVAKHRDMNIGVRFYTE